MKGYMDLFQFFNDILDITKMFRDILDTTTNL
jgi:hypothetical protein